MPFIDEIPHRSIRAAVLHAVTGSSVKKAGPVTGPGEVRCQPVATTVGTALLSLTVKPATRLPKMTGPLNASKAGERTG